MVAAVVVLHRSTQKVLAVLEEDILLALVVVEHNLTIKLNKTKFSKK